MARARWISICCRCGKDAWTNIPAHDGKPAAAYCGDHHAEPSAAFDTWRKARMAERKVSAKAAAEAFWTARGIRVGDRVRVFGQSLYGRFPILGVARAGVGGPYVFSPRYGQLDATHAERAQ